MSVARTEFGQMQAIEELLLDFMRNVYGFAQWPGVVFLMGVESGGIPLPSELIMPLAGWMLVQDRGLGVEWLFLAAFFGALGNLLGSLSAYYGGAWGGRSFILRYGRYLLISPHDLARAEEWFRRWGSWAVFLSRLMPVVRTFISFPAGVARMPIGRFSVLTFLGSYPWSLGLAWGGYVLGENWEDLRAWMRPADAPILAVSAAVVLWYAYRHVRRAWASQPEEAHPHN